MNRSDFQQLADLRIKEAKVLLDNGCHEGAYYLAGYAVECALKACIAKLTQQYDFPNKDISDKVYSHDLNKLAGVAGVAQALDTEIKQGSGTGISWGLAKEWNEKKRYEAPIPGADAHALYSAITDDDNGVLPWLKKLW